MWGNWFNSELTEKLATILTGTKINFKSFESGLSQSYFLNFIIIANFASHHFLHRVLYDYLQAQIATKQHVALIS